jgi:hypothetical protein
MHGSIHSGRAALAGRFFLRTTHDTTNGACTMLFIMRPRSTKERQRIGSTPLTPITPVHNTTSDACETLERCRPRYNRGPPMRGSGLNVTGPTLVSTAHDTTNDTCSMPPTMRPSSTKERQWIGRHTTHPHQRTESRSSSILCPSLMPGFCRT